MDTFDTLYLDGGFSVSWMVVLVSYSEWSEYVKRFGSGIEWNGIMHITWVRSVLQGGMDARSALMSEVRVRTVGGRRKIISLA